MFCRTAETVGGPVLRNEWVIVGVVWNSYYQPEGKAERKKKVSFQNAPHPSEEMEGRFRCLEDLKPEIVAKHAVTRLRKFTMVAK
ncbi:jg20173 [Pararge aegeria aegeria]|uniref:Jg20173 protein n=1 Tax=Pararge aegeria aegeria TaxID=348720 RepID=A0A8S4S1I0_9NEOP|nr:jg20173 [Pararge aegeria aegeria]